MRHRTSALALAVLLMTGAAAAQQPAAPPAQPGGVAVVQTFKGKAVVLFVNYDTRNVTLNINGALHSYTVSDSVKGFSDIHQGDTLTFVADTSLRDLHGFKVGDHVAMRYTAAW